MQKRKLMAVGAHADDIELDVGGTLAKYYDQGYEIVYVMSTNNFSGGWSSLDPDGNKVTRKPPHYEIEPQRKLEAVAGAAMFGAEPIHLDHPQRHYTRADKSKAELRYGCELPKGLEPDIPTIITAYEHEPSVQVVTDLIVKHQPDAVITHSPTAGNVEHFATSLLVTKAYWKAIETGYDGMLVMWPELGITVFGYLNSQWNSFIDVSKFWDKKFAAISKHACQIPIPENLDFPDWSATCGCEHAEVFTVINRSQKPQLESPFALEIMKNWR